ncbi:ComEC/Rec2 family competence protein [Terriglobus saanensis]|uniref:DNA internalization-related competence protein ComEC/Rec2 n=1 Tax=Terriglobus saanensis (strain ATCC BAA-1853 / DSM 23119 / SP1PR4) TaxID=401053 RepID=E8V3U0_TERSS|nr:ComEC/Rec2 family competence protein [Terriglobus saanensis]ADV81354.1 DNA internalization-related competence protein ComEC/Rec2 [Terriglobus saanensis SP1PR4]
MTTWERWIDVQDAEASPHHKKYVGHPARFSALDSLVFRTHPLFFAALCFATGITSDRLLISRWQTAALRVACTCLLVTIAWFCSSRPSHVRLLALGVAWIALGWTCASLEMRPQPQTGLQKYADGLRRDVDGTVQNIRRLRSNEVADEEIGGVEMAPDQEISASRKIPQDQWVVDLAMGAVEDVTPDVSKMVAMDGVVRITMQNTVMPELLCGDQLRIALRLRLPQGFRDPGVWQYPEYLQGEGVGVRASSRELPRSVHHANHASLACGLLRMRKWAEERIERYARSKVNVRMPQWFRVTETDAGIFNAMLLGDRSALQRGTRLDFERTGSFHLLVVAGLHVGLVAWGVYSLLLWLRCGRTTATLATMFLTSGYAVLTGFGLPVQRALWMTMVFLIATLFARQRHALNALGASALGMLIVAPSSLFEAGFQMTILAVIAIAGIALPLAQHSFLPYARASRAINVIAWDAHLAPVLAQFRVSLRMVASALLPRNPQIAARALARVVRGSAWLLELVLFSAMAELIMSLPMMIYFHRLTPFALPANLICIVLIPFLMGSLAILFVLACVGAPVAAPAGVITAGLLHAVTAVLHRVSLAHGADWRVAEPSSLHVVAFCILMVATVWLLRGSCKAAWIGVVLLPTMAALILWPIRPRLSPERLEMTAVDVGQGDSIFVASPDGHTMLIDAGGPVGTAEMAQSSHYDVGEEIVSPYLWSRGVSQLDVMVLTHAHGDHMGGMSAVLGNFHPRELWISVDSNAPQFRALLQQATHMGIHVRRLHAGDAIGWGQTQVQVLSPAANYSPGSMPNNNDSLAMRITWQKASFLLEGDAEAPSEEAMLKSGQPLKSSVLKVGHHGSRTSTTPPFLAAVAPAYAVISDGRDNRFGHPRMEILQRLQAARSHTFRTDMVGATTFLLHADGQVETSSSVR